MLEKKISTLPSLLIHNYAQSSIHQTLIHSQVATPYDEKILQKIPLALLVLNLMNVLKRITEWDLTGAGLQEFIVFK